MLVAHLPQATYLLADRGYDATWVGNALLHKGITPASLPGNVKGNLLITTKNSTSSATSRKHVWANQGLKENSHRL